MILVCRSILSKSVYMYDVMLNYSCRCNEWNAANRIIKRTKNKDSCLVLCITFISMLLLCVVCWWSLDYILYGWVTLCAIVVEGVAIEKKFSFFSLSLSSLTLRDYSSIHFQHNVNERVRRRGRDLALFVYLCACSFSRFLSFQHKLRKKLRRHFFFSFSSFFFFFCL